MSYTMRIGGGVARAVPVTLCLQALFGGTMNLIGWIFFGFGMIFFWIFGLHCEACTNWKFIGPLATTSGTVVRSFDTGASVGGSEHQRGTPIYGYDYTFTPPGSTVQYRGTSYTTGSWSGGDTVTVEYQANHPTYSRIQGMRAAEFGVVVLFVVIFPLVGLIFIVLGLRKGIKAIAMLRYGTPAAGTLINVAETNTRENKQRVYKMTFQFTTREGGYGTAEVSSTKLEPAWWAFYTGTWSMPEPVQDEFIAQQPTQTPPSGPREVVLYDASDPAVNFVPAEFGYRITVDAHGNVRGANPATGIFACLIPLLVIVGHGWYLLSLLGR